MYKMSILVSAIIVLSACGDNRTKSGSNNLSRDNVEISIVSQPGTVLVNLPTDIEAVEVAKGVETQGVSDGVAISGGAGDAASSGGRTQAFRVVIDEALATQLSEKPIIVYVTARGEDGTSMKVAYSTNGNGNSGWKTFALEPVVKTYALEYRVPVLKKGRKGYIGILPVDPQQTVILSRVAYEVQTASKP